MIKNGIIYLYDEWTGRGSIQIADGTIVNFSGHSFYPLYRKQRPFSGVKE